MEHKLLLIRKLLRLTYDMLFTTIIVCTMSHVMDKKYPDPICFILLFLFNVISYIIRDLSGRMWISALLHVMYVVLGVIFVPSVICKVALSIVSGILLFGNVMYLSKGMKLSEFIDTPWVQVSVCLVLTAIAFYAKDLRAVNLIFILTVAMVIVYLITLYTDGMNRYLSRTQHVEGLPIESIMRTNSLIVAGTIVVILLIVLMGIGLGAGQFMSLLVRYTLTAVIAIVLIAITILLLPLIYLLFKTGNLGRLLMPINQVANALTEENRILMIIERILGIFLLILLSYLVFKGIRKLIEVLMIKRMPETDSIEYIDKKTASNVIERKGADGRNSLKENRIRRKYRKTVLKYRRYYLPDSFATTEDIKTRLADEAGADLTHITDEYESVRYGRW